MSKPKHSLDPNRPNSEAPGRRSAATVRRLNLYKRRPVRNKRGKIVHEDLQSRDLPNTRIAPDRRWFGNTRVIGQKQLEKFREEMRVKVDDAFKVLLREKKLPLTLLQEPTQRQPGIKTRSLLQVRNKNAYLDIRRGFLRWNLLMTFLARKRKDEGQNSNPSRWTILYLTLNNERRNTPTKKIEISFKKTTGFAIPEWIACFPKASRNAFGESFTK